MISAFDTAHQLGAMPDHNHHTTMSPMQLQRRHGARVRWCGKSRTPCAGGPTLAAAPAAPKTPTTTEPPPRLPPTASTYLPPGEKWIAHKFARLNDDTLLSHGQYFPFISDLAKLLSVFVNTSSWCYLLNRC